MEFKINSKALEKLLSRIIPAVPTRTPMPILENFLLEINNGLLTVSATDLEISLKSSINVTSDENIKIVIPAKLFFDIVRSLDDTIINFKVNSNFKIKMVVDNGTYNIGYAFSNEFPEILDVNKEKEISMSGSLLKKSIDQTSFALSKEDMRPAMTGLLIEFTPDTLNFVSTDGHRLVRYSHKNIKSQNDEQYIIPERAISVLSKLIGEGDVKLFLSKTHIAFLSGDIEFTTRLIGEKYPAYNSVIPLENENLLKISTKELLATVRRMILFSSANSKQVKLSLSTNMLNVSAEDIDHGSNAEENISCEYIGEPMNIGFNTIYLSDILSHINSDKAIFKLHSPTKACIVEPDKLEENEELMLLLMPVRLNN